MKKRREHRLGGHREPSRCPPPSCSPLCGCAVDPSPIARIRALREGCNGSPRVIRFTTSLQSQLAAVEARDAKFADQLRRSLSVGLSRSGRSPADWTESTEDHGARGRPTGAVNLGEGYGASGGEKRRAYRVARADAAELEMGLEMVVALGCCGLSAPQRDALQRTPTPTKRGRLRAAAVGGRRAIVRRGWAPDSAAAPPLTAGSSRRAAGPTGNPGGPCRSGRETRGETARSCRTPR